MCVKSEISVYEKLFYIHGTQFLISAGLSAFIQWERAGRGIASASADDLNQDIYILDVGASAISLDCLNAAISCLEENVTIAISDLMFHPNLDEQEGLSATSNFISLKEQEPFKIEKDSDTEFFENSVSHNVWASVLLTGEIFAGKIFDLKTSFSDESSQGKILGLPVIDMSITEEISSESSEGQRRYETY